MPSAPTTSPRPTSRPRGFSIYPEYTYSREGQQSISGYRVNNNVSVKVRKTDSVGEVLDDAIASGGNDTIVNGVSFTIENTEPLVDQARDLAAKDARRRADQLAGELGVRIERVLSVAEFGGATPPVLFRGDGRGGEQAAAIQPTPGQRGAGRSGRVGRHHLRHRLIRRLVRPRLPPWRNRAHAARSHVRQYPCVGRRERELLPPVPVSPERL